MDVEAYLEALASAEPVPGGGSAATVVGALAAALCAMVARITLAGERHAAVHSQAAAVAAEADDLRRAFLALRPQDESAFGAVVAAQALPRGTAAERAERTACTQRALVEAAAAPLLAAQRAVDVLALAGRAAALGNRNLDSDVACALRFARAAFDAAIVNVDVNHRYIADAATVTAQRDRVRDLAAAAHDLESRATGTLFSGDTRPGTP